MDASYLQRFLSDSAKVATRNEIRELLKVIARPEVISLAGGLPSPETFPTELLARILPDVLREHGASALQYGSTEGDLALRRALVDLLESSDHLEGLTEDHILVTSASQQGLDLCARLFLARGDAVVCGLPSYLGALGCFTACGARLSGVPLDEEGMRSDLLEQRLVELRRAEVYPKLLYVVPDFQNPAGVTLSLRRRQEILAIAREFDLLVVEDSPYRQLRYVGESLPSLSGLDLDGRVISLFTFSKILTPGLRLGWLVADPEIVSRLVVAKQPVDLCTSGLSQLVAWEFLRRGRMPRQLERIRTEYSSKREAILRALERHVDPHWGVDWTRPEGGLFVWLTLPVWMDAAALLQRALAENVAFVAGSAFHCDGLGQNTLRLNFSYPSEEDIEEGVRRLTRAIAATVERAPRVVPPSRVDLGMLPTILADGRHSLEQLSWNLALAEVVG